MYKVNKYEPEPAEIQAHQAKVFDELLNSIANNASENIAVIYDATMFINAWRKAFADIPQKQPNSHKPKPTNGIIA